MIIETKCRVKYRLFEYVGSIGQNTNRSLIGFTVDRTFFEIRVMSAHPILDTFLSALFLKTELRNAVTVFAFPVIIFVVISPSRQTFDESKFFNSFKFNSRLAVSKEK